MARGRPKSLMSREEKLAKKREAEQRRRNGTKLDPQKYSLYKHNEHLRYLKRKAEGKIKMVGQLNSREARARRKDVRERVRQFRLRQKLAVSALANTPLPSPNLPQEGAIIGRVGTSRKQSSLKKKKRQEAKVYRLLKKQQEQNQRLKRTQEKYKKRYQRLQAKISKSKQLTPRSKVNLLLQQPSDESKKIIRKKLVFGDVLSNQLALRFKSLNRSEKQIFVKAIGGDILRRYRCMMQAGQFFSYKLYKSNRSRNLMTLKYERAVRSDAKAMELKVHRFLLMDENSTQCPGKRDVVTIKRVEYQKRYFNDSLKNLHKEFCKRVSKISYGSFCRLRPKYIFSSKLSDRDTCLCVKHENMRLFAKKLRQLQLLCWIDLKALVASLCCEQQTAQCFLRVCQLCSSKTISFTADLIDADLEKFSYKKWEIVKENRLIKGKETQIKRMVLNRVPTTVNQSLSKIREEIIPFMRHSYNVKHQCDAFKSLRNKKSELICCLQVDFSENYVCKYSYEPQSVHFGASKQQLSLHTGVLYCGEQKISFCTTSANLRHDAKAIAAHLEPILNFVLTSFPNVTELHFLSDGPSAQYKNRTIFAYIGKIIPEVYPQISKISWNYSEAGHGKGPADGVGGCLKRSADKVVAQRQRDVDNISSFIEIVKAANPSVKIVLIADDDFKKFDERFEQLIPVPQVKKTMQVHQVTWSRAANTLQFNELSCELCTAGTECSHWKIDSLPLHSLLTPIEAEENPIHGASQSLFTAYALPVDAPTFAICVEEGDWIAVIYDDQWYPGLVEKAHEETVDANFLARGAGTNNFFWPAKFDRHTLKKEGILYKLKEAPVPSSRRFMSVAEYKYIDLLKNSM